MRVLKSIDVAALALLLGLPALSQVPSETETASPAIQAQAQPTALPGQVASAVAVSPAVRMIEDFKDSDVKFDMNGLVDILRDRRHEGWVLAAYPDPRTGQPLVGAGFSLDLPERDHLQPDALNSHQFLEPSSADLWQAAGFDPERLDSILKVFYERKQSWSKRTWRRQLYSLPAQISDEDATQLVRVGAIQAIYNSRAYCRKFDQLTGPQQMAMAQLVYQMGVNLQHFNDFLAMINSGAEPPAIEPAADSTLAAPDAQLIPVAGDQTPEYWQSVQKSLMGSQWAHKYRTRAIAVIAMLDPTYGDNPSAAEQRVGAVLRPAVVHRRRGHAVASTRQVAATHRKRAHKGRPAARSRNRKRA
ncbi:MAG TPA: hypothetical protein VGI45_25455 [Terracidiphilus sp.]